MVVGLIVVGAAALFTATALVGQDVTVLSRALGLDSWLPAIGSADEAMKTRMAAVLQSLLAQEQKIAPVRRPRVAVGYGACQDLFVDATVLLADTQPPETPAHFNEIRNEEELRQMFAYFFRHGAAAERFVSEDDVFERLVAKAKRCEGHREAVGGNAPVMALRFAREGADVLLAAKMTPELRRQLPDAVQMADVQKSGVAVDDVHLILEYKRGERWGRYEAPRANRFIVHSDINNPSISSLEAFGSALPGFKPHLLLVSGLQVLLNLKFK